jgi:hypothetical protein
MGGMERKRVLDWVSDPLSPSLGKAKLCSVPLKTPARIFIGLGRFLWGCGHPKNAFFQ